MGKLISEWRLREIVNIADVMAFRAALCPVNRLLALSEEKYLKPGAHIRLFIHPGLKLGEATHYIQHLKEAKNVDGRFTVDLYEATIFFNGNLHNEATWKKTMRAIVQQLGAIIFFSPAAKRQVLVSDKQGQAKLIKVFVEEILKLHPFGLEDVRSKFTLAKLQRIIETEFDPEAKMELLPYLDKLLRRYLGPDGW